MERRYALRYLDQPLLEPWIDSCSYRGQSIATSVLPRQGGHKEFFRRTAPTIIIIVDSKTLSYQCCTVPRQAMNAIVPSTSICIVLKFMSTNPLEYTSYMSTIILTPGLHS